MTVPEVIVAGILIIATFASVVFIGHTAYDIRRRYPRR
jgi:hypothetical protein